ncbi:MAG TPA: hypothetical protein PLP23_21630 [Panacibacter sp.]|nr:hypothetical protein [Panacibacter sp.]
MQTFISIFSLAFLFFASCNGQDNNVDAQITGKSKAFKKEIPIYKDGRSKGDTEYLFKAVRQEALELGLDFIENGFDSLQVRIWLGHSMAVKRNVVVLKQVNGQWFGQIITYSYEHNNKDGKQFISDKEIKEVSPKSGWTNFIKALMDLQMLTLPNGQNINGYNSCGGEDGIDYFFETASPEQYRFYYYCNPNENVNQFWQVKNVVEFSNLLEKEFDFTYTK